MKKGIIIICLICVIFCTIAPIGITANAETKQEMPPPKQRITKGEITGFQGKEVWDYFFPSGGRINFGLMIYFKNRADNTKSYIEYMEINLTTFECLINGNLVSWDKMTHFYISDINGIGWEPYLIYINTYGQSKSLKGYDFICEFLSMLPIEENQVTYHFYNPNIQAVFKPHISTEYTDAERTVGVIGNQNNISLYDNNISNWGVITWSLVESEFTTKEYVDIDLNGWVIAGKDIKPQAQVIYKANQNGSINEKGNLMLQENFFEYPYIIYENNALKSYNEGKDYGETVVSKTSQSYKAGYIKGTEEANNYTFNGLITSAIDIPVKMIIGLLDFEILGTNILSLMGALLGISIVIFIAGKILKL